MVGLDSCARVHRRTPECRGACHARRTSRAILYDGSLGCFLLRPLNENEWSRARRERRKGGGEEKETPLAQIDDCSLAHAAFTT